MILKCKPTYNFQSIEFEYELGENEQGLDRALEMYQFLLDWLKNNAPEQPNNVPIKNATKKSKKIQMELATEKQISFLVNAFGEDPDEMASLTKEEAKQLLKHHMNQCSK